MLARLWRAGGCWILDTGCWILDGGFRVSGVRIQETGIGNLE
ncbi:hypothetical protein D3OALGA1CA_5188 [Olavius algarvensis associated proteobacterium Delta 3]|nr:hypothetical protein D3OALGB2SA_2704 [Olavius algarvensis associated proteobacterium Delta 3]CAB5163158.1 hypothetical protein D3OALGA1CA_5188 [Olavius algarvensis associated proteobacterium Delta 3]